MVFLLPSCTVYKHSEYFQTLQQKDTTLSGIVSSDFESVILPGDRLSVSVSSLNPVEDVLFNGGGNTTSTSTAQTAAGTQISSQGYLVQPDGTVVFHRLGVVKVQGLSRRALITKLESELKPYLKEPIVQVNFINHKITVMGEVTHPGIFTLPDEKLSVIDALVLSGDVTSNAKRNNVTVIRDEGNEKKVMHVNLQDNSAFSSPAYYLKPNDIVFVSADTDKTDKEEKRRRLQTTLALVASGASLLVIILDRIIK